MPFIQQDTAYTIQAPEFMNENVASILSYFNLSPEAVVSLLKSVFLSLSPVRRASLSFLFLVGSECFPSFYAPFDLLSTRLKLPI